MSLEENMHIKMENKPVPQGTTLLTEKPFVYVLSSKLRTEYCDFCLDNKKHTFRQQLQKCSGCYYVYYCGRLCQKEAWPVHKLECNALKKVAPRVVPDAARLLARLIRKMQKGGGQVRGYYMENKFRLFKDLMSHYSDLKKDQHRMEHFTSLCGVLFDFLGANSLPNSAELMGIYGRMCVNSFNICDSEMRSLGTGMYLGASILDHSCDPNALATFEGTTLHIRTVKNIPALDFSQIFISYIDTLDTPESRQNELFTTYYFKCPCSKCISDLEELDVMLAAACLNPDCDEPIDLRNATENSDIACSKCDTKVTAEFIDEFQQVMDFTKIQIQSMKHTVSDLDVCKVCLKRHRGVLHNFNIYHVKILDMAFESSIDFGQWDDARQFGKELIPYFTKYYGEFHPLLGLLCLKYGKILLYMEQLAEAREYLMRAKKILKVTHGSQSLFMRKTVVPILQQVSL